VGFASTYEIAYEMAKEYDEDHDTSTWGMGMRIYEILILG
jgi:hypothetical protein